MGARTVPLRAGDNLPAAVPVRAAVSSPPAGDGSMTVPAAAGRARPAHLRWPDVRPPAPVRGRTGGEWRGPDDRSLYRLQCSVAARPARRVRDRRRAGDRRGRRPRVPRGSTGSTPTTSMRRSAPAAGRRSTITQPSPGQFALAYEELVAARLPTEILSIHVGAALAGTLELCPARRTPRAVPVRLVDTGRTASGSVAVSGLRQRRSATEATSTPRRASPSEVARPTSATCSRWPRWSSLAGLPCRRTGPRC